MAQWRWLRSGWQVLTQSFSTILSVILTPFKMWPFCYASWILPQVFNHLQPAWDLLRVFPVRTGLQMVWQGAVEQLAGGYYLTKLRSVVLRWKSGFIRSPWQATTVCWPNEGVPFLTPYETLSLPLTTAELVKLRPNQVLIKDTNGNQIVGFVPNVSGFVRSARRQCYIVVEMLRLHFFGIYQVWT